MAVAQIYQTCPVKTRSVFTHLSPNTRFLASFTSLIVTGCGSKAQKLAVRLPKYPTARVCMTSRTGEIELNIDANLSPNNMGTKERGDEFSDSLSYPDITSVLVYWT